MNQRKTAYKLNPKDMTNITRRLKSFISQEKNKIENGMKGKKLNVLVGQNGKDMIVQMEANIPCAGMILNVSHDIMELSMSENEKQLWLNINEHHQLGMDLSSIHTIASKYAS